MAPKFPKLILLSGVVLTLVFTGVLLYLVFNRPAFVELSIIGKISDFALVDQNNQPVKLSDLKSKVWVADVIFTRCPGPCAKMTHHLAELQKEILKNDEVKIVTLTSDPDYDTPEVLKRYATRFGADTNQWQFLTGDKATIRKLAVNDFKFVVVEKSAKEREVPEDLFIHSTWFVLVDGDGNVRGWKDAIGSLHAYFDSEDAEARKQLVICIRQLAKDLH